MEKKLKLLEGLKPCMSPAQEQEWIKNAVENGMEEETARIAMDSYKKGTMEYLSKYLSSDSQLQEYICKYTELAIKVCEKLI